MERILIKETLNLANQKVAVSGWVHSIREHGKVAFIDLRDSSGVLQVVFTPEFQEAYDIAKKTAPEWVITIEGKVKNRPEKMINKNSETGNVELVAEKIEVISEAKTPPLPIDTTGYEIAEEKRLKYRYLDLRRERLQNNLKTRHKVFQYIREFLTKENFVEIETPILTKSTPEGARDFVVPSRLGAGKFYALPQSPQQYKQLLQVAGFEKYFQIVRCFRDEDPRADRQPEFTQLDIEMSFVEQKEVLGLIERLFTKVVKDLFPNKQIQQEPFPVLSYKEAMEKYGSDKPDLRKDKNNPNELAFCFVVNFPMFEWKETENRWDAVHHPFTLPQTNNIEEIKNNPKDILAFQYDLALNGYEIAGGSIRSHQIEVLEAVFETMGHEKEQIREKFAHLLEAFEYGVPPHGGIASGIDRFLAILLNEPNIREVIPFPKTGDNRDLMMDSPSEISKEQLKELHIKINK